MVTIKPYNLEIICAYKNNWVQKIWQWLLNKHNWETENLSWQYLIYHSINFGMFLLDWKNTDHSVWCIWHKQRRCSLTQTKIKLSMYGWMRFLGIITIKTTCKTLTQPVSVLQVLGWPVLASPVPTWPDPTWHTCNRGKQCQLLLRPN